MPRHSFNLKGTKRPLNICRSCGYTWYPRGKNLSPKCPLCGSSKTQISYLPFLVVLLGIPILLAIFLLLGDEPSDSPEPPASPTSSPLSTSLPIEQSFEQGNKKQLANNSPLLDLPPPVTSSPQSSIYQKRPDSPSQPAVPATGSSSQSQLLRRQTEISQSVPSSKNLEQANAAFDEQQAEGMLSQARESVVEKKRETAIRQINRLIEQYPNTKAAQEAKELLKAMQFSERYERLNRN